MGKAKPVDPVTWLKTTAPRRHRRCAACNAPQDVRHAIEVYHRAVEAGETHVARQQFLEEYLIAHLGWEGSLNTLQNHLRSHMAPLKRKR